MPQSGDGRSERVIGSLLVVLGAVILAGTLFVLSAAAANAGWTEATKEGFRESLPWYGVPVGLALITMGAGFWLYRRNR